jgi:hypothetical protein
LDIVVEKESIRLGVIESDLIIKGYYSPTISLSLQNLAANLKLNNIYYIGNIAQSNFIIIDNIFRMELKM